MTRVMVRYKRIATTLATGTVTHPRPEHSRRRRSTRGLDRLPALYEHASNVRSYGHRGDERTCQLSSRIWIIGLHTTVSASATAEAYNPSGQTVPVAPKCVKPWIIPNTNPQNLSCAAHFVDTTTARLRIRDEHHQRRATTNCAPTQEAAVALLLPRTI